MILTRVFPLADPALETFEMSLDFISQLSGSTVRVI